VNNHPQEHLRVLPSDKGKKDLNKRALDMMIPDPNINTSLCYNASSANPNSQIKSKSNRRRSLFHIPLGARSKSFGFDDIDGTPKNANNSINLAGSVLPQDIIREIVDRLSPADILSFSLTVRVLLSLGTSFFLLYSLIPVFPFTVLPLPCPPSPSLI
jgi:hypothetical protein